MLESTRLRPNPTNVFEVFVIVKLPSDGGDVEMETVYPKEYEWDADTKKNFPKFCFPCKNYNPIIAQHFSFVLTDMESKYRFGHCLFPAHANVCYCFFSHLPWHDFFYGILDKVEMLITLKRDGLVQSILKHSYEHGACQTWYKGGETRVTISPSPSEGWAIEDISLNIPDPTRLPSLPEDHCLNTFYTNLNHNVMLAIFASLIFERRILMTAKSMEVLTGCVQGASTVLYPLYWQHIFCPVLPPHLMDYCCAPMPFLIGVHSSLMEQAKKMPLGDIVIVDIDANTLESPFDDLAELPEDVISDVKHVLKKQSSCYGETVARAFVMAFIAMIGDYKEGFAVKTTEIEINGKVERKKEFVFDPDSFKRARPDMANVLDHLPHFQHFQQFVNARLTRANSNSATVYRDLFDKEMMKMAADEHKRDIRAGLKHNTQKLKEILRKEVKKLQRDPNFAPLEDTGNEEKIGSLRHDRMTLELEAQIVRAKMKPRGAPPVVPKPYAKYKEEKTIATTGKDGATEELLIPITPTKEYKPMNLVAEDSHSTYSTSSSSSTVSSKEDEVPSLPAPIPPPRPHRKKKSPNATPTNDSLSFANPGAFISTTSVDDKLQKRESLDFSSSIAAALADIDPSIAVTLKSKPWKDDDLPDFVKLPPPLEPERSTPSPTSHDSNTNNIATTPERTRCNAMSSQESPKFAHTKPAFIPEQDKKESNDSDIFSDLLDFHSTWNQTL